MRDVQQLERCPRLTITVIEIAQFLRSLDGIAIDEPAIAAAHNAPGRRLGESDAIDQPIWRRARRESLGMERPEQLGLAANGLVIRELSRVRAAADNAAG